MIQLSGLCKRFPGVNALENVDFFARAGEVHALMGENGAGKSTLIKVLTGVYQRDGGQMLLDGRPISPRSPRDAQELGISTVYQEVNLIPTLSVAENIFLGRQPRRWARIDWKSIRARSEAAMARLHLPLDANRPLSNYSIAIQQMVAIARALDVSARVLILDEPTSSLDTAEVAQLFAVMRKLRDEGLAIVFVTHFLEQVYAISDRITVLRDGKLVGEFKAGELARAELVAKMMGRKLAEFEAQAHPSSSAADEKPEIFLDARGIGRRGSVAPLDLQIPAGQVVGLAGLLGSGRTETARLLFGMDKADCGSMQVAGKDVAFTSPRDAIRHGLALCPEDRKTQGIIADLSVQENIVLALAARGGVLGRISRAKQHEIAQSYIRALGITTPHAQQPIRNLSGGNQQKAILARWIAAHPKLLILDEPTRGIDVGAKAEIQKLILSLCAEGMSILFISSELEEVTRVSDRVVVLRDRKKIGELPRAQISADNIMRMIGGAAT